MPSNRPLNSAFLLGIVSILGSGCAACRTVEFDEHCCIAADRLEIHYELDGFRGGYWSRALMVGRMDGSLADNDPRPLPELPNESKTVTCQRAELHVVWPHSECRPDKARAIIRLWHRGRVAPARLTGFRLGRPYGKALSVVDRRMKLPEEFEECHEGKLASESPEIYTLDFQRSELDLILPDLVCAGFFADQHRPNGGARLIVQVDKTRVQKIWTPEPRLDDLLTRVSVDGRRFVPHAPDDASDAAGSTAPEAPTPAPGDLKSDKSDNLPLPPLPEGEKPDSVKPGSVKGDSANPPAPSSPGAESARPKPIPLGPSDERRPDGNADGRTERESSGKADGRPSRRFPRAPKPVRRDDAARPLPEPPAPTPAPNDASPPFEEPAADSPLPPSLPPGGD